MWKGVFPKEKRQRTRYVTKTDTLIVWFSKDPKYAHINVVGDHLYHRDKQRANRLPNIVPTIEIMQYINEFDADVMLEGSRCVKMANEMSSRTIKNRTTPPTNRVGGIKVGTDSFIMRNNIWTKIWSDAWVSWSIKYVNSTSWRSCVTYQRRRLRLSIIDPAIFLEQSCNDTCSWTVRIWMKMLYLRSANAYLRKLWPAMQPGEVRT